MSDTEEVVLSRKPQTKAVKNTKPEIAREKLKEKRERLKKEKEAQLIEAAKVKLLEDQQKAKEEAEKAAKEEDEKKKSDPMYAIMMKLSEMTEMMRNPGPKIEIAPEDLPKVKVPKPRAPAKKKEVKISEPAAPKRRAPPKKKAVLYQEDSSQVFVGSKKANIPQEQTIQYAEEPVAEPQNVLLQNLLSRRRMGYY